MMGEATIRKLETLTREIQAPTLSALPRDLQWAQLGIWAVRYRLLLEGAGHEHAADLEFKRVFRLLRTKMAGVYPSGKGPFLPGLRMEDARDWTKELEDAKKKCEEIVSRHRLYTETREKLTELESFLAQGDPKSEDDERRLHHLIRNGAKYENLRGELADMLEPYRDILPAEFGFLWGRTTADEAPAPRAKLSNYDITCRILRRLIQNRRISEGYIPIDMITLGFEGNDRGRAKAAVEILVRAGVLLKKKNGDTISLSHQWVAQVNRFREGAPMGNEDVDEWVSG